MMKPINGMPFGLRNSLMLQEYIVFVLNRGQEDEHICSVYSHLSPRSVFCSCQNVHKVHTHQWRNAKSVRTGSFTRSRFAWLNPTGGGGEFPSILLWHHDAAGSNWGQTGCPSPGQPIGS